MARKHRGWTQVELAFKARMGQGMVSRMESGAIRDPRFSTVVRVAKALHMQPEGMPLRFIAHDDETAA